MAILRLSLPPISPRRAALALAGAAALGVAGAVLYAQIEGDRGIAPVASTGDYEVSGIAVEATGKTADEARAAGWRMAQRKAWEKLWASNGLGGGSAPVLDDGTLSGMVSAIVVESEQIGPHRYIGRLGVIFDRSRTASYLGLQGQVAHSAPLLVIPVLVQGGTASVFEWRTPWQRAWAEFRTGESVIDYVRPSGMGSDSLLLTAGQLSRRSRTWWRMVLDQFGAADVVIPIARLERQWPGGPVKGTFVARHGPDNRYLDSFELTADSEDKLPAMLADAVRRLDGIYARALAEGRLAPDPTLFVRPQIDQQTIDAIVEQLGPPRGAGAAGAPASSEGGAAPITDDVQAAAPVTTVTVQFVTPDAAAVDAALSAVRAMPGVREAATTSLAMGGTSVMRVSYAGELDALAAGLRAGGWKVTQGAGALLIRR